MCIILYMYILSMYDVFNIDYMHLRRCCMKVCICFVLSILQFIDLIRDLSFQSSPRGDKHGLSFKLTKGVLQARPWAINRCSPVGISELFQRN